MWVLLKNFTQMALTKWLYVCAGYIHVQVIFVCVLSSLCSAINRFMAMPITSSLSFVTLLSSFAGNLHIFFCSNLASISFSFLCKTFLQFSLQSRLLINSHVLVCDLSNCAAFSLLFTLVVASYLLFLILFH